MTQLKQDLVPLSKAVAAAILDTYEDKGRVEQLFFYWAADEFKEINRSYLRLGKKYVTLLVNHNTHTATLPVDFKKEDFVGTVDYLGRKVPLSLNTKLANSTAIEEISCEDACEKCNQSKSICNELQVSEDVNLIVINGTTYEENVTKKLYPNGDYFLEKNTPVYNVDDDEVEFIPSKEFITNLDLKDCGCLETTSDNLDKLKNFCPETYGCYYAPYCNSCEVDLGGYKIFEDTGLIQLDFNFPYDRIYLEYQGFLPKVNGQYMIPEISLPSVREGVKYRSILNRKGEPQWRILLYKNERNEARSRMWRLLNRVSLSHIIEAAMTLPKFDIRKEPWQSFFNRNNYLTHQGSNYNNPATNISTIIEITGDTIIFDKIKFTVGEEDSLLAEGATTFVISKNDVAEKNVMQGSVNLLYNGSTLYENETGQVSFTIVYTNEATTITLNQGVSAQDKLTVSYAKKM